jgi:hypothetical protein
MSLPLVEGSGGVKSALDSCCDPPVSITKFVSLDKILFFTIYYLSSPAPVHYMIPGIGIFYS